MINTPTTFILGAGASKTYGYPTGAELRTDIILHFKDRLAKMLPKKSAADKNYNIRELEKADEFINVFDKSKLESIDKFLALKPEYAVYGKIAIAISIIHHEQRSEYSVKMEPSNYNQNWYSLLFNRMMANSQTPDDILEFLSNKVSFITFNYDRSLDHYLYEGFYNSFSKQKIKELFKIRGSELLFPIIHVYGYVDKIDFHGGSIYKAPLDIDKIVKLSSNLRVIGERADEVKGDITEIINNSKRIFFLGFGYDEENLKTLNLSESNNKNLIVRGTALGMTENEINSTAKLLQLISNGKMPGSPKLTNKMNCYELLREYL